MTVTIQQVAQVAGVSRSTANMILTGRSDKYAEETRTRVLDAAKQLAYRPNIAAQSLKNRRSYLIGAIFSHLNATYMSEFLAGLQTTVASHGCAPTLFVAHDAASELEAIKILKERRVDGIIVNPTPGEHESTTLGELQRLHQAGMPMVEIFGRACGPNIPSVITDAYIAGRNVTQKMIEMGCQRPVLLCREAYDADTPRTATNWFDLDFYRGYSDAAFYAGIEPWQEPHASDEILANAPGIVRDLLDQRQPDGVVTFSLSLTREVILAINLKPERAPDHFTLGGLQDYLNYYPFCRNKATIRLAIREAAEQAADQLFNLIQGRPAHDLSLGPTVTLVAPTGTSD